MVYTRDRVVMVPGGKGEHSCSAEKTQGREKKKPSDKVLYSQLTFWLPLALSMSSFLRT